MIQKASINVATVQSILNQFHIASNNLHVNHVVEQLKNCRTKALGYHLYKCTDDSCLKYKYQYHSCSCLLYTSFGSNEPLVIIDGVQTSGTNTINPNDIESINICLLYTSRCV